MSNSSIWPIDKTLSGATTPSQCGPGSNDNEGLICIPQNSVLLALHPKIVSCYMQDTCWVGETAEMQSIYSTPTHQLTSLFY